MTDLGTQINSINKEGLNLLAYMMRHESVQNRRTAKCAEDLVDDVHRVSDDVDFATEKSVSPLAYEMVKADGLRELADIKKTEVYVDYLKGIGNNEY